MRYILLLVFIVSLPATVFCQELLLHDGLVDDWNNLQPIHIDDINDSEPGMVNFDTLMATDQYGYLHIRINIGSEVVLQRNNDIRLLIDSDNDSTTGLSDYGIGVDFAWEFGNRRGLLYLNSNGNYQEVFQGVVKIQSAPTVSSTIFEIVLPLNSSPEGFDLFPGDSITFAFEEIDGDRLPDQGGISYQRSTDLLPDLPQISIDKEESEHIRVVTWNVLRDNILDNQDPFQRLLQAVQPDIIGFEEVWESSAQQIENLMNQWIPLIGQNWYCEKVEGDVILASRWEITESVDIPNARASAFLTQMPETFNSPMMVVVAHPPCCDNDEGRQEEIDAIMSFVRDSKTGVGGIPLIENTPIIITGDMNLVGWAQQYQTFVNGDIVNTGYGPDFMPDWDDSPLTDATPRHNNLMQTYTWRYDESEFSPGRLDFIFYTDSQLIPHNNYVLDSRVLSEEMLNQYGIQVDDSYNSSDHLPVVCDFSPANQSSTDEETGSLIIPQGYNLHSSPNPFNSSIRLTVQPVVRKNQQITIYDLLGREINHLSLLHNSNKSSVFKWDGTTASGLPASSGIYMAVLHMDNITFSQKLLKIK